MIFFGVDDFIFIEIVKALYLPIKIKKIIKSLIKYSKDVSNVDLKIIVEDLEATKSNEYSKIKKLIFCANGYVDQIDFIFEDWFKTNEIDWAHECPL